MNLYRIAVRYLFLFVAATTCGASGWAQVDVLTWHNDAARTGQNLKESLLTPMGLNASTFGLLANIPVDGKVDAQPLYVSALNVNGMGTHNVLFVATEHDTVYAIDADTGSAYWQTSILLGGESTSDARSCSQVAPEIGITSTPVIDRRAGPHGTIFLVGMSKDGAGNYYQRLHALDLSTGAERPGSPVSVQATYPGTGSNSFNGSVIFDPKQYKDRPALLLLNGSVLTSWSSHCDIVPYTGWVIAYSENTLQQTAVINFAPNGADASPWNAGAGPAADVSGNVYLALGNGTFDSTLDAQGLPSNGDYGNSAIKLQGSTLAPLDYWTMFNTGSESGGDVDLGSGGLMLLPDQVDAAGNTRHLAVAAGKDQNLYVLDRDQMGHFDAAGDTTIYQELSGALPGGMWSSPAYFNGHVFYGSVGNPIRSFTFSDAQVSANSIETTVTSFGYPGTTPSISAYGSSHGILWATENSNPAVLHAYDSGNVAAELYNSNQAASSRDHFGVGNKFIVPTIANGKVYVGTTNSVAIFGAIRRTPAPVPDGDYTILNRNSQLILDDPGFSTSDGIAVFQWSSNGGSNQKWFLSYSGDGYYTIQNVSSKLFLTDANGSSTSGIHVVQSHPANDDTQLWSLVPSGGGFVIENKATAQAFDDSGFTTSQGPYIILWRANGGSNQIWDLR